MKPIDLACRPQVADVIGEAYADHELQRVIDCEECGINEKRESLIDSFPWDDSPQKDDFWGLIHIGRNPYEHGHEKPELSEKTPTNSDKIGARLVPEEQPNQKLKDAFKKAEDMGFDKPTNKYKVLCKGVEIDVYDVLMAYSVTNPADQHAIKKMLMPGKRGVKDANQDRREAIQSLERAIELAQSDK